MKAVRDFDFSGNDALVRADLDLPVEDGEIKDDFRLRKAIPTVKHLLNEASRVILMGHLGRPGGVEDKSLSLKPVADRLGELIDEEVSFATDYLDGGLPDGKVIVLENLRFHSGETNNDDEFAKNLASLGDIYVNESFASSHRRHASTVGVPKHLPGCIGLQFQKELKHLKLDNPKRPVVGLLGGAKLETKMPLIKKLITKVDYLLLGGAMMFTFFQARGWETGKSVVDEDFVLDAKNLLNNEKITLPEDVIVAGSKDSQVSMSVPSKSIPKDKIGLDIGPKTKSKYEEILKKASTVLWNGPVGYDESEVFTHGTTELAEFIANLDEAKTIIGGGDTAAVVDHLGIADKFTHVSTGGGASLQLLEGKELPAVKALEE